MSNDITITSQPGATVGTAAAIFSPEGMDRLVRFATLMADSKATVPAHLAGKPADCLAVTMQAAPWGMNPFAVAQKTHVVNGTLGYEAQLVNAVVSSSNLLATRLNYRWDGDWSKVNGKSDKSPDRYRMGNPQRRIRAARADDQHGPGRCAQLPSVGAGSSTAARISVR